MARATTQKVVTGYVVKRETIEEVDDPKRAGQKVKVKRRVDISRVYHSIDAAKTFLEMCQKQWPDGDFYVHERRKALSAA